MDDADEYPEVVLRKSARRTSQRSDLKFRETNVTNSGDNCQISEERRNEVDTDDGSGAHEQVCLRKQMTTQKTGDGGASSLRRSRYLSIKRASLPPPPPTPSADDIENTETLMQTLVSFHLRLGPSQRSETSIGQNGNRPLPMRKSRLFPTARQSQIFEEKRRKLPPPPPVPK